jgi:hypothetical protein
VKRLSWKDVASLTKKWVVSGPPSAKGMEADGLGAEIDPQRTRRWGQRRSVAKVCPIDLEDGGAIWVSPENRPIRAFTNVQGTGCDTRPCYYRSEMDTGDHA